MSHPKPTVAIVGLSAELPSGNTRDSNLDHDAFFEFLLAKGEAYEQVPVERFNIDAWQGSNLGQVLPRKGCFLKNITEFDHAEFGISSKDAHAMGLSTRKLLEHSFLALLDSGIDSRGQDVGVYTAGTAFDILSVAEPDIFEARGLLSGIPSMIANKVSYHLDLTGPSIPIDTACSSTLTALHLAVQALRAGECNAALFTAIQPHHSDWSCRFIDFVQYSRSSVLAPDGKCKPFDAAADGFSRGEGVVVVVLKLLDDAIRDGDHIYASILGTAVNATGSAAPAYAPVAESQRKAMEKAFSQTDCSPSEVDFVELHATGTAAGDPTEANWVGSAFAGSRELLLGSVKGNVGHLEITAFLASLCKVCSIFKTGLIPPTVNLTTPNPAIHWKKYHMRVPSEISTLSKHSGRSLIAMTSSGIGGSNGHAILESPPACTRAPPPQQARPVLLVAGGLSPQSASAIAATLAASDPADLTLLSTIYGRRSRQLTWRTFATWVPGQEVIKFPTPVLSPKVKAPIVFVFSGQGPQHFNMGRQLFRHFEAFRTSVLRMDKVYRAVTGQSLVDDFGLFDEITPKITLPDIWPTAVTQPALIILEMALYDLFLAHGISPDIVISHSAGATAMLYASGAISQEMAVEIATARGLAMRSVEAFGGAMAAVGCTEEQAAEIIRHSRDLDSEVLEVGCFNGPGAVALSGSDAAIDRAVEYAQNRGFFARKLKTRLASHSSLMERCREDCQARMLDIYSRYPGQHIPSKLTYSTQTGSRWTAPFTADYMWNNARNPVYFAKTIAAVWKDHPNAVFVEISPHPVLSSYIASVGIKPDFVIAPLRRTRNSEPFAEVTDFLNALGTLTCLGCNRVDFHALNGRMALKGVSLPPYPFNKKHIPYCSPSHQAALTRSRNGPLNYEGMALNMLTHPDLAEHVIKGEPILPATAYLEMAFEFGATHLWNVEFIAMLPLLRDKVLRCEVTEDQHRWEVKSWSAEQPQSSRRLHACGYMATDDQCGVSSTLDIKTIQARCLPLPVKRFYDSIAYFAQYGPAFRQIRNIWTGDNEAIVEINNDFHTSDNQYIFNPAILDSCLHVLVHPAFTGDTNQDTYYLPSRIQEVLLHTKGKLPTILFSHSTFREWHPDYIVFDIVVVDPIGNKICSLLGVQIAKHGGHHQSRHYDIAYQPMSSSEFSSPRQLFPCPSDACVDNGLATENAACQVLFFPLGPSNIDLRPGPPLQILNEISYPAESSVAQAVISILEICNVSGSLSRLLRTLTEQYSTISLRIVTSAVASPDPELSSGLPSISFDLNKDLASQGLVPWNYDIIVGVHALGFVDKETPNVDLPIPEAEWISKGLREGSEYHRFDRATWTKILPDCGFTPINTEASELFFVLAAQRDALSIRSNADPTSSMGAEERHPQIITSFPSPHHALELRTVLSDLEGSTEPQTLWVESTTETVAGSAARGFTRSLRREGLRTDIRLVLFDASWQPDQRKAILRYLAEFPHLEREVVVDADAKILVPRIVLRPTILDQPSSTELSQRWEYHPSTTSLIHSTPGSLRDGDVLVRVLSTSRLGPLAGIVGVVHATRTPSWTIGTRVVGVSACDLSNFQVFFEGEIAELPADADIHASSTLAVPLLILALSLGSSLLNPRRLVCQRAHIAEDSSIVNCIQFIWRVLNLNSSSIRDAALCESSFTSGIVIAGRLDSAAIHVLKSRIHSDASLFIWDDPISGILPQLQRERWLAGDILQKYVPAISIPQSSLPCVVTGRDPHELIPPSYNISHPVQFDPTRVYLLLGGIGSFGIHVAIWMYTRGARQIVLTSRSGIKSLYSSNQQALRRAFGYLTTRPDLHLHLEACDATSEEQMSTLLKSINRPLAGCMLLSAVLVDGSFMSFDPDSLAYQSPIASKINAFQVIEKVIAIDKLDFFISTSSVMSFGSAGQTNYSAANTALEWLTGRYPNAFSLVAPGIADSTLALDQLSSPEARFPLWLKYAMSSSELCECIENGLKKLRMGPFSTYIPDLSWEAVEDHLGTSPLYQHLLVPSAYTTTVLDDRDIVEKIVLNGLHLDKAELDPTVPLTSYGLDSLSASRMASELKSLFTITQLQLLADVTLQDLQGRLTDVVDQHDKEAVTETTGTEEQPYDWKNPNQQGENIVKLVIGRADDIPLILVHGSAGDPVPFQPLQQRFTSALWAFQYTPDTPLTDLDELASFYFAQIKAARPNGPYRLGAFSATCLVALELARRLEADGETVLQLAFIDHFPLLYASPVLLYDWELMPNRAISQAQHDAAVRHVFSLMQNDPHENWTTRGALGLEAKQIRTLVKKTGDVMLPHVMKLLGDPTGTTAEERQTIFKGVLGAAVDEIKAPVTLYVASRGIFGELRAVCPSGEWDDYGIGHCHKRIDTVIFEKEGHLSLLHSKIFSDLLENSWEKAEQASDFRSILERFKYRFCFDSDHESTVRIDVPPEQELHRNRVQNRHVRF
ncbi:Polyketide synthase [Mycena sanguinolenta]|uniref:Polyketide synthase n=1 Tax=Mycena sanguinolenta TaxID=230812 RepID=A0A8H6YC44_9AGAR|nr:Polyketide synthase [Mycena sanguinolenta]